MLRTLSPEERTRFGQFLRSPYHNEVKDPGKMVLFVELVFQAIDSGEDGEAALERTTLYKMLYPENNFVASTLNNLAHEIKVLLEKFIVWESAEKTIRPKMKNAHLVQFFKDKGDFKLGDKYLLKQEQENSLENSPDNIDFLQNWQAEEIKSLYLGMKTDLRDDYNLLGNLNALEQFFLISRLENLAILFNQNNLSPFLDDAEIQALRQEVCNSAARSKFDTPLVQIYCKVLAFLSESDEQAKKEFDAFWELLAAHSAELSPYYLENLESFAYNFCTRYYAQEKYKLMLFELLQRRMQPERLSKEKNIQAIVLLSMVKTGLIGEQYELAQSLLKTFRGNIKGRQESSEYYKFCQGYLYFYTEQLEKAWSNISNLAFYDTTYKHFSKVLETMVLFELGERNDDIIESKLLTFRVALSRERNLPKVKIIAYQNFAKYTLALVRWRMGPKDNRQPLRKMVQKIAKESIIAERTWLRKTLEKLLA